VTLRPLTRGSTHRQHLPCVVNMSILTVILIAQAVFFLQRRQTELIHAQMNLADVTEAFNFELLRQPYFLYIRNVVPNLP